MYFSVGIFRQTEAQAGWKEVAKSHMCLNTATYRCLFGQSQMSGVGGAEKQGKQGL